MPRQHVRRGQIRQAGEHSPVAQDADVVGRRVNRGKHVVDCDEGSVHCRDASRKMELPNSP